MSKLWSDHLSEEFKNQIQEEQIRGGPISTELKPSKQIENQIYFSTVIVQPLLEILKKIVPEMEDIYLAFLDNLSLWSNLSPTLSGISDMDNAFIHNLPISGSIGVYVVPEDVHGKK